MTKPRHRSEDCLHCDLWPVINKFCADHPNGVVEDVLMALADVIGDQLASEGSAPYQDEFIGKINDRIKRRIEHVRAQTDMWVGVSEDLIQGIDDGELQDAGMCIMEIGERGQLTRQQARRMGTQWRKLVQRHPDGVFWFSVDGYGDDPRELWEIPEVVRYVRQWARFAGMDDLEAAVRLLGPQSPVGRAMPNANNLGLLGACGVFGDG